MYVLVFSALFLVSGVSAADVRLDGVQMLFVQDQGQIGDSGVKFTGATPADTTYIKDDSINKTLTIKKLL